MSQTLKAKAAEIASQGRFGDDVIIHMNRAEVAGLASLAPNGRLPINPKTGLPEAFFFLPFLASLGAAAAPAAAAATAIPAMAATAALPAAAGLGAAGLGAAGALGTGLATGMSAAGLGGLGGAAAAALPTAAEIAATTTAAAAAPAATAASALPTAAALTPSVAAPTGLSGLLGAEAVGAHLPMATSLPTTAALPAGGAGTSMITPPVASAPFGSGTMLGGQNIPMVSGFSPMPTPVANAGVDAIAANFPIGTPPVTPPPAATAFSPISTPPPAASPAGGAQAAAGYMPEPISPAPGNSGMPMADNPMAGAVTSDPGYFPAAPKPGGLQGLMGGKGLGMNEIMLGSMLLKGMGGGGGKKKKGDKKDVSGVKYEGGDPVFPGDDYSGGIDDEWDYFPKFASGGIIGLAQGGLPGDMMGIRPYGMPPSQPTDPMKQPYQKPGDPYTPPPAGGIRPYGLPSAPDPRNMTAQLPASGVPSFGSAPTPAPSFAQPASPAGGIRPYGMPPAGQPQNDMKSAPMPQQTSFGLQPPMANKYAAGGVVQKYAAGGLASLPQQQPAPMMAQSAPMGGLAQLMQPPAMSLPTSQVGSPYAPGGDGDQELIAEAVKALQGQHPNADAVLAAFIQTFGEEALQDLAARVEQTGLTKGGGDGMSDSIPATIDGQQPAALSSGEFVVPADVVSGLGNGSTDAGAQELNGLMERVRMFRGGVVQQPPRLNPKQVMPV